MLQFDVRTMRNWLLHVAPSVVCSLRCPGRKLFFALIVVLGLLCFSPLKWRESPWILPANNMQNIRSNIFQPMDSPAWNILNRPGTGVTHGPVISKEMSIMSQWERMCREYRTLLVLSWVWDGYALDAFFTPDNFGRSMFPILPCIKTCIFITSTNNRSLLPFADIAIFNFLWTTQPKPEEIPPQPQWPGAVYVYTSMEPPPLEARPNPRLLSRFNYFWSYRRDLPFSSTYHNFVNLTLGDLRALPTVPFQRRMKTPVATLISNCNAHSGRRRFHEELMKHIDIHNYGPCLHNMRPPPSTFQDMKKEEKQYKMELVVANYKFVFAIENSLCTDYISEKLGRSLRHGVIPIVASANLSSGPLPDYSKMTPNDHCIFNVMTFSTVKEVAERINEIANDEELFSSFLTYRKQNPKQWPRLFHEAINEKNEFDNSPLCRLSEGFFDRKTRRKMMKQTLNSTFEGEECTSAQPIPRHFNLPGPYSPTQFNVSKTFSWPLLDLSASSVKKTW